MARQRISPGTVGPVAVVPLGTHDDQSESVIPNPTADDGTELPFAKGLKAGDSIKVEKDWSVSEYAVTRWRGLARVVDTDGTEYMVRRWRSNKAAAESATRQAGIDRLAALAAARQEAQKAALVAADGDVETTVSELVERAMTLPDVAKLATRTRQNYLSTVKLIHAASIGAARPRDVDVAMVRAFLADVAKGHGTNTAMRCRAILRRALDLAVESKSLRLAFNPVLATRDAIPAVRVQDRGLDHRRVLDDAEVIAFLAALQGDPLAQPMLGARSKSKHGEVRTADAGPNGLDLVDLLSTMFGTGLRLGEALALRWSDLTLDGDRPVADVSGTVIFENGSGAVRQPRTKTTSGDRPVPLSASLAALLTARAELFGADLQSGLPVFGSPQYHDRWRDPSNTSKAIRAAFKRHGHDWASSHLARRYRVTSLLDRGVPVGKVSDMIGHSKVSTTLGYVGRGRGTDDQVRAAL